MENVKQTIFEILSFQSDHQGFLEEEKVGLTDNIQTSDPTKEELYWMRTLRTFYPDGLNIESGY